MRYIYQSIHNHADVLNGDSTATLEYIDQRMAELQEKLVMCVNKNAEYDVIAKEIDALEYWSRPCPSAVRSSLYQCLNRNYDSVCTKSGYKK